MLAIMLNPSIADERRDDPTTTFMIRLAQREGCQSYEAVNLFALVDTDPAGLRKHHNPVGLLNDAWIVKALRDTSMIVAAWGNHGAYLHRQEAVTTFLSGRVVWCFGTNANGSPRFPRAIKSGAPLVRFLT